jgi:hypothetical protein
MIGFSVKKEFKTLKSQKGFDRDSNFRTSDLKPRTKRSRP